jgi:hypothetical protein
MIALLNVNYLYQSAFRIPGKRKLWPCDLLAGPDPETLTRELPEWLPRGGKVSGSSGARRELAERFVAKFNIEWGGFAARLADLVEPHWVAGMEVLVPGKLELLACRCDCHVTG